MTNPYIAIYKQLVYLGAAESTYGHYIHTLALEYERDHLLRRKQLSPKMTSDTSRGEQ